MDTDDPVLLGGLPAPDGLPSRFARVSKSSGSGRLSSKLEPDAATAAATGGLPACTCATARSSMKKDSRGNDGAVPAGGALATFNASKTSSRVSRDKSVRASKKATTAFTDSSPAF